MSEHIPSTTETTTNSEETTSQIANMSEEELKRLQSQGEKPRLVVDPSSADICQTPEQPVRPSVCPPAPERNRIFIVRPLIRSTGNNDPIQIQPVQPPIHQPTQSPTQRTFTTARQLLFSNLSKSTDSLDSFTIQSSFGIEPLRQWKAPRLVPSGNQSGRSRKVLGAESFEVRRLTEEARVYQSYPK